MQPACLIVEDQWLIAEAIEAHMTDIGWDAQIAGSEEEALASLEDGNPSLAVIDYLLADGPCRRLAAELKRRDIPFVVYSGCEIGADTPVELLGVPWIAKPCRPEVLVEALESAAPAILSRAASSERHAVG